MPSINYKRPPLYDYQTRLIDSEARFTVCEAATKTGKTASHIIWLHEQALKGKKGYNYWWVAPVASQAKIAFTRLRNQITDKDYFKANETYLTLTLPNGAIIWFKSAEKPDNLFGEDVYAAVFDEFTRAREESWFALRTTLSSTGGPCKFIGNVKGKKNWGYRMGVKAKNGERGYEYFKITAYDAANAGMITKDGIPFIEEIESAKRDLPENVFRELYLAEAGDDASNPFGIGFIQLCVKPLSTKPVVCFGVDLAKYTDFTVIIGLDARGDVAHFERFQHDWRTTTNIINTLPRNIPLAIDSTGVGDPIGEEIARGRNVDLFKFTSQSKQQLMEGLAVKIQRGEVGYPDGPIKEELENFEYVYTRTGVRYSAPEGLHDDCVCALALAASKHTNSSRFGKYSLA